MNPSPEFDAKTAAKKLLREARSGALATLMPGSGDPYCSLVNVATAADGAPLLLISQLAVHTKNILADPRVSLMLDERKEGDPLQGARVMLMGTAAATGDPQARSRYLARQPEAEMFAGFSDFAFYRVNLEARASGGWLWPHRRSYAAGHFDRGRRRARTDWGRAGYSCPYECGSRRHLPALRDQASRRARRRVALCRQRPGGARTAARPHGVAAALPATRAHARRAAGGAQADGGCRARSVTPIRLLRRNMQRPSDRQIIVVIVGLRTLIPAFAR